jgi:hypothetical protein
LFVSFVPMVHETYQSGSLAMCCCTSFAVCFGISIGTVAITDNDDPPLFYPSCSHGIKHHINKLWALHCKCKKSCIESKDFFFLCYFNLVFTFESFYHLSSEHNSRCPNLLQSSCKPLDRVLVWQASTKMLKSHPLSKNCCSFSLLHRERKHK